MLVTNVVVSDGCPYGQHLNRDALGGRDRNCKRARGVKPAKQFAGLGAFAQVDLTESAGGA